MAKRKHAIRPKKKDVKTKREEKEGRSHVYYEI